MSAEKHGSANNFNFIRLVLATLVIVSHSSELVDGDRHREPISLLTGNDRFSLGSLAVCGFFLLSGYLITGSWKKDPRLFRYLDKRIRRIYPGFVAASAFSVAAIGPFAGNPAYWANFSWGTFLGDLALLQRPAGPPVFPGMPYPDLNGSTWTISHEFACYLLLGLLGMLGILHRPRVLLALVAVATPLCCLWTLREDHLLNPLVRGVGWIIGVFEDNRTLYALLVRLPEFLPYFLVGACFATFLHRIRLNRYGALIAGAIVAFSQTHACSHLLAMLLLPAAGGYLLFAAAFAPSGPLQAFGRCFPDISYGIYLYAWPIQSMLIYYHRDISPLKVTAITIPTCAALGLLSWELVEKRFLARKRLALAGEPS